MIWYLNLNGLIGLGKLTAKEKKEFREFWGMMEKLLTQNDRSF
jgi:hypothetical protein